MVSTAMTACSSLRKRFTNNIQYTVNYTYGNLRTAASGFGDEAECYDCVGDARDTGPLPNGTAHAFTTGAIFGLPGLPVLVSCSGRADGP
jgi:hypothetical protein